MSENMTFLDIASAEKNPILGINNVETPSPNLMCKKNYFFSIIYPFLWVAIQKLSRIARKEDLDVRNGRRDASDSDDDANGEGSE